MVRKVAGEVAGEVVGELEAHPPLAHPPLALAARPDGSDTASDFAQRKDPSEWRSSSLADWQDRVITQRDKGTIRE